MRKRQWGWKRWRVWAVRQKKEGRKKLVSVTRGRRDRNLFCKGELTSYDIMLVMMDVTPL
jgi:hypothetical protein